MRTSFVKPFLRHISPVFRFNYVQRTLPSAANLTSVWRSKKYSTVVYSSNKYRLLQNMAQRSITSFFTRKSSETASPVEAPPPPSQKARKRHRIDSDEDDTAAPPSVTTSTPPPTPLTERDTNQDSPQREKEMKLEKSEAVSPKKTPVKSEVSKTECKPSEYDPAKLNYHPLEDACWGHGQPVPYAALARTLHAIESISARLRIVTVLSNYLRSVIALTPQDLLPSIYLCLNRVAPAHHGLELGVAESYLMKALAQATGRSPSQVKSLVERSGDLGLAAEQARATQRVMFQPAPLTVRAVLTALKELPALTGHSSMNKKVSKIQCLLVACRDVEARYLIRSLAGKLRIGLAEQSVLQALAQAAAATPPSDIFPPPVLDAAAKMSPAAFKELVEEHALIIKTTYCECPDYERILPVLLARGVRSLPDHCRLTPGVPLKPMLAHPTRGVREVFQRFENVQFTCEWKYDGERAQIHVPSGEDGKADLVNASIFSRNQENNTSKYPDVLGRLGATLNSTVDSCVLDCEAVAYDVEAKRILPFQILSTRKRKDVNAADIKVQVCVFIFDLLYLNGESLVKSPLSERRSKLRESLNEVEGQWQFAVSRDCTTLDEMQGFLEEAVKGSCEGLMVKTLVGDKATYEIARRSRNWLKLKKDYLEGVGDSVDAVVIGAYHGRGKRAGAYGGFLLACYDPETEQFQSLCKIGTGFSDEDLQRLSTELKEHLIPSPRAYYRYDGSHEPDAWFSPSAVWEVLCADLSLSPAHHAAIGLVDPDKGISLRFPRFVRARTDKSAEQATSASQIAELYLAQDSVQNQPAAGHASDDFY